MKTWEVTMNGEGLTFACVVGRFNELIGEKLLQGACDSLQQHGVENIEVVHVAGAFEIPLMAKKLAESGRFAGVICLGAIIKGETPHFDFVAQECASGIMQVSLSTGVPVSFGVLTTNTVEEALNRCGLKAGNKGRDVALACLEMVKTFQQFNNN